MIIYLAGGMPVVNVKGREFELASRFEVWNRLQSYAFRDIWPEVTFEVIRRITNADLPSNMDSGNITEDQSEPQEE